MKDEYKIEELGDNKFELKVKKYGHNEYDFWFESVLTGSILEIESYLRLKGITEYKF